MERERVVENELGEQDVKLDVLLLSERSRQALVGGGLQLQGSRNLKIMPLLQQRKRCARGLRLLRFHLILHLLVALLKLPEMLVELRLEVVDVAQHARADGLLEEIHLALEGAVHLDHALVQR